MKTFASVSLLGIAAVVGVASYLSEKAYYGKYYFALRFSNDLCVGVGKPPQWMKNEALSDRPHAGI